MDFSRNSTKRTGHAMIALAAVANLAAGWAEEPAERIPRAIPVGGARRPAPVIEEKLVNRDLSLRECVEIALLENLDLEIEQTAADSVAYDLTVAKAEFDPQWEASSSTNTRRDPQASTNLETSTKPGRDGGKLQFGIDKKLRTGANVEVGSNLFDRQDSTSSLARLNPEFNSSLDLSLTQPLLKGAGRRYNEAPIKLAKLAIGRSNHQLRTKVLEVVRNTELAYWGVVAAQEEETIVQQSIELSDRLLEEAEFKKEGGLATRLDVLQAQAGLAERKEALYVARQKREDRKDALFLILGILDRLQPGDLKLQDLPWLAAKDIRADPEQSYKVSLDYSPKIQETEIAVEEKSVEMFQAKRDKQPGLDLRLNSGLLSRDASFNSVQENLYTGDAYYWEFFLEFHAPWGRRAEKARYQQARLSYDQEKTSAVRTHLGVYTAIRSACREIRTALERLEAAALTVKLNAELLEKEREKYRNGEATIRSILEIQEDFEDARLRELEAKVSVIGGITLLSQLEGTLLQRYGINWRDDRTPATRGNASPDAPHAPAP